MSGVYPVLFYAFLGLYLTPLFTKQLNFMKKRGGRGIVCLLIATFTCCQFLYAQTDINESTYSQDWFLKDPQTDHLQGVSAERAYNTLLKGKESRTVLVAVIDSGIDIDHEDLKDVIWTNEDEIPGNGIDDDHNGYVDDVHGWSFLGNKNGNNVDADTYELTREYVRLKKKYEGVKEKDIKGKQRDDYNYWKKIEADYLAEAKKAQEQYNLYSMIYENISHGVDTLRAVLGVEELSPDVLDGFQTSDQSLRIAKGAVMLIFQNMGPDADVDEALDELKEAVEHFETQVEYGYNPDFNSREIVGDNYSDVYEKGYGCNDVKGPDPSHGTHVAGIIGANRKNDIGIKGIADNVRIMSVRAVPNGDERDKDVANAIIYAADNGAQVINMSFGKSYSPQKYAVDKAVKYAESKGVLLIHAAGNEGKDIDTASNYPTRYYYKKWLFFKPRKKEHQDWIEVGASSWSGDEEFAASFSNFGKHTVDLFAPGVDIYSTYPNNEYKKNSGTSMASPSTAGVAALIMSYFPKLTADEVKEILMKSTRKFDNLQVIRPGSDEEIAFADLSRSGGVVDVYEAVKMAEEKQASK